ncbi:MAG: DUF2726 domain-containing protein [Caldilinea sp. CFX5]|nr:DUF2726 domain-containing protein [Caldilinea sp. CFX5]
MHSYTIRESMLDPIEQSLYRALSGVLCQRALLFTKINLGDLFMAPVYHSAEGEWGTLANQRIDFVLCDRDSMRPLALILFADSALRANQVDCSERIAQLCAEVGLPLVRLERQSAYVMHQLIPLIENLLSSTPRRDDFTNGDRAMPATTTTDQPNSKRGRRLPAYPGYGALRTIANKPV